MKYSVVAAMKIASANLDDACATLNKNRTDASAWRCARQGDYVVMSSRDGHFPSGFGSEYVAPHSSGGVDRVLAGLGDWLVEHQDGTFAFFGSDKDFRDHFKAQLA